MMWLSKQKLGNIVRDFVFDIQRLVKMMIEWSKLSYSKRKCIDSFCIYFFSEANKKHDKLQMDVTSYFMALYQNDDVYMFLSFGLRMNGIFLTLSLSPL